MKLNKGTLRKLYCIKCDRLFWDYHRNEKLCIRCYTEIMQKSNKKIKEENKITA